MDITDEFVDHTMKKSLHQHQIELFMDRAGQHVPDSPTMPSLEVRRLRAKLILEEALETIAGLGLGNSVLNELEDPIFYELAEGPNLIAIADGCADLSVVTIGTLSACGIADLPLLREVDESNLRKFEPPTCCGKPGDGFRHEPLPMQLDGDERYWLCAAEGCGLSKALAEGPHRRPDGKWLKGKNFRSADVAKVLKDQGWDEKESE